ncbi:MAG: hypothetical protein IT337_06840 [Thermomicrobiales bacterium]|nr:hypothetical protein [Thermomicrobiales bacterium]
MPASVEGTPVPAAGEVGSQAAIPAFVSVTRLDVSMEDILTGEHAINVHKSAQDIGTYIACGEVGGIRYGDTIQFGLHEQNNSGYTGVALISSDEQNRTNVVVYLAKTAPTGGASSTPSA